MVGAEVGDCVGELEEGLRLLGELEVGIAVEGTAVIIVLPDIGGQRVRLWHLD